MISDVRSFFVKAETSAARLRRAVGGSDLPPNGAGLGAWIDEALPLRCAVSVSEALFGVGRASEIAALAKADVVADEPAEVVELKIRCRGTEQLGVGQIAHIVAFPAWKGSCPMRLLADWLRFRDWLSQFREPRWTPSCVPRQCAAVGRSSARTFRFKGCRVWDYGGAEEGVGW